MLSTVQFVGDISNTFGIKSGVKQGCVLVPTLFGIFFALLQKHAFRTSSDGVYLPTRTDGRLFNIARLCSKSKISKVTVKDLLFADDAAIASHTQNGLQRLMDRLSNVCDLFSLTISLKKTQLTGRAIPLPPTIRINEKDLEVVNQFQYLGSTTTDSLSLYTEISKRIGKAATTLAKLTKRVWDNKHLTHHQSQSLPDLCHQYPALRQRILGDLCASGKESSNLPYEVSAQNPLYHLAGQSHQHRSARQGRHTLHVRPLSTKAPPLDRPCA